MYGGDTNVKEMILVFLIFLAHCYAEVSFLTFHFESQN